MSFPTPPDFDELAKSFEETGAHLRLLADKPDVQQGNLIVKALNDINSRLGNVEKSIKDMHEELAHVHGRVDDHYQERLCEKAIAYNNATKEKNKRMYNGPWIALRDVNTNQPISIFPHNQTEIQNLSDAQRIALLQALGYDPSDWSAQDKANTLRSEIG